MSIECLAQERAQFVAGASAAAVSRPFDIMVGANVHPDPNSGAAGTVIETSLALSRLGHHVESFWAESIGRRISHGNLHNILELPHAYRREVRRRMRSRHFDVVQLSQPHSYLAAKMVVKSHAPPVMVWRSHGLEAKVDEALIAYGEAPPSGLRTQLQQLSRKAVDRAQRQALRWSDGAIVPCEDDREFLIDRFGADAERVRVIWHGVPDDYIDAAPSADPARWSRMLHVSQLSANKGPMVMHEVATRVLAECPEATMTWVCPAALHADILEGIPAERRSRLVLTDWVDRAALKALYDSHGIFLFPTLAEGAAKVVMEAMARGMCVVASDTSGPRDYIASGTNGCLVAVGDAAGMADAAIAMVANSDRCRDMGSAARKTASAFRWDRCARQMVDFYSDLRAMRNRKEHSAAAARPEARG